MVGSKAQNSTSSEYGHVAYQIKRNQTCSNIIGNILPADPPPPANNGGLSVKMQLFQNINILHIKGSLTLAMGKCLWFSVNIKVCQFSLSSP